MQAVRSRLSWKQFKQKLFFNIQLYAAYGLLRLLFMTMRCQVLDPENIEKAKSLSKNGKYIAPIWHQNIILNLSDLYHHRQRVSCLVSASKDGQFLSNLICLFGHATFRGSSNKVALAEMKELLSHLSHSSEDSLDFVNAVDGPRGPIHVPKLGIVQIARLSNTPIVPMVMLPNRYWQFNSWDRFRLPKPFSTLYVAPCSPVAVDKTTPKDEFPVIAQAIKEVMLNKEKEIRERFNIKS